MGSSRPQLHATLPSTRRKAAIACFVENLIASTNRVGSISQIMRKRRPIKPRAVKAQSATGNGVVVSRLPKPTSSILITGFACVGLAFYYLVRYNSLLANRYIPSGSIRRTTHSFGQRMAPVVRARVVAEYDHDHKAFTQGLVWYDGHLYESTGLQGASSIRKVELDSGKIVEYHPLEQNDFGEGLALVGPDSSRLVQVLWKTGKGFVYDRNTLLPLFQFSYDGDAWGLASLPEDRNVLFLSNGTSTVKVFSLDGTQLKYQRQFTVFDGLKEVGLLNELEVVGKELWANVWMSDFIARIDIHTGKVNSWVDVREILRKSAIPKGHTVDVLNGIAYDENSSSIYVTGKHWPKLFSIRLTDKQTAQNITEVTNAFFLDRDQVEYVHKHILV